jgi:hypothetical protein
MNSQSKSFTSKESKRTSQLRFGRLAVVVGVVLAGGFGSARAADVYPFAGRRDSVDEIRLEFAARIDQQLRREGAGVYRDQVPTLLCVGPVLLTQAPISRERRFATLTQVWIQQHGRWSVVHETRLPAEPVAAAG